MHGRLDLRYARSTRCERPLVGSVNSAFGSGAGLGQVPERSVPGSDPDLSTASSGRYVTSFTFCDERAPESVALGCWIAALRPPVPNPLRSDSATSFACCGWRTPKAKTSTAMGLRRLRPKPKGWSGSVCALPRPTAIKRVYRRLFSAKCCHTNSCPTAASRLSAVDQHASKAEV